MQELELCGDGDRPLVVLCLGAHCDDIEIGCGATLLRQLRMQRPIEIHWVVLCSTEPRMNESLDAFNLLTEHAAQRSIDVQSFEDGFLPWQGAEVKRHFERLKQRLNPDIIFTHTGVDRHQDHRTVSELTWNTFRDHVILEYEIPKYDGDLGAPGVFVPIAAEIADKKIDILLQSFASQRGKQWFTRDTFQGLMRLRGLECNAPEGYAEAFYARKLRIRL